MSAPLRVIRPDYADRATPAKRKPCGACQALLGVAISLCLIALLALEQHIGGVP